MTSRFLNMFRSRSWFGGGTTGLWKPKNPHSLEHLKYLYTVLSKNQTVSENNRSLLVETLRSIAEILIWGDQNDSTVFDFFLEKNMLSFFLKIMRQKCGSYVCVQLLQTLNILFENIRNETSLYYLLSNNHVNSIIVHKFDFSDEEVMAYYISFLKTLSLKLNSHTIHFFYNEHTHDFPLYTEAIKFFNNSESMVRIAVRTLTLNVYRIHDKSMLKFIRDKTAAPYFSNLVWFIGNHVYELDGCIRDNAEQEARIKLADLVAEHLDHLHYLNDILCLNIEDLNQVLTEHLLHRLLIPLYVTSLNRNIENLTPSRVPPKVSSILSLFLLSQVFLIMTHPPLVQLLAKILVNGNVRIFQFKAEATPPKLRLSIAEDGPSSMDVDEEQTTEELGIEESGNLENISEMDQDRISSSSSENTLEKMKALEELHWQRNGDVTDLSERIILNSILDSLDVNENDYAALFALCLLHALRDNSGIDADLINSFFRGQLPTEGEETNSTSHRSYNRELVQRLITIITQAVKYESKVRLITLQLLSSLLLRLVMEDTLNSQLEDGQLAIIEGAREENILLLQSYYKMDEMFLEVFEDEYLAMTATKTLSIEHLMMDSNLLLPPVGSPMTGIQLDKRLPCGEIERSRRSIRVYFILRKLSLTLRNETEKYLPLTNPLNCVHTEDNLDLTNSDMLSCTVVSDNLRTRRFLVVDVFQLLLVDPSLKQMGWGVVKFVGFLQDIEVVGDRDDSRCLHITVKTSPTNQRGSLSKTPLLVAKFLFDDHIRCMAAKQRLIKGKQKARQGKLHLIAKLLDLTGTSPSPQINMRRTNRRAIGRSMYTPLSKALPGVAMAVNLPQQLPSHSSGSGRRRSRESSPAMSSRASTDEEIPLGNIRNATGRGHRRSTEQGITSTESVEGSGNPSNFVLNLEGACARSGTNDKSSQPPLLTPQSETSFMTLTTTSTGSGTVLNSRNGRRKKGMIETV